MFRFEKDLLAILPTTYQKSPTFQFLLQLKDCFDRFGLKRVWPFSLSLFPSRASFEFTFKKSILFWTDTTETQSPENSEMYPECFITPWDAIVFLLDAENINRRPISSVGSVSDNRAGGRGFEPWLFTSVGRKRTHALFEKSRAWSFRYCAQTLLCRSLAKCFQKGLWCMRLSSQNQPQVKGTLPSARSCRWRWRVQLNAEKKNVYANHKLQEKTASHNLQICVSWKQFSSADRRFTVNFAVNFQTVFISLS